MPVIVRSLGSGSSGNALLVTSDRATIVIDCGLSAAAIARGLKLMGRGIETVSALLVSHEHVDHVRSVQRFVSAGTPIVATSGTVRALDLSTKTHRPIVSGDNCEVRGGIVVHALGVSHDAAEPVGFCVDVDDIRLSVITDLGTADPSLHEVIATSNLVVVEANHDETMLRRGPYPAHLKRRVLSAIGHLSNKDCGLMLSSAFATGDQPRTIWLAHLSAVNNRPDLAVATVAEALNGRVPVHAIRALTRQGTGVEWRSDLVPAGANPVQLSLFG